MPFLQWSHQYFTKGEQMPKRSPKIGCGPFGARTLFSGFSRLFRDLLILHVNDLVGMVLHLVKPQNRGA